MALNLRDSNRIIAITYSISKWFIDSQNNKRNRTFDIKMIHQCKRLRSLMCDLLKERACKSLLSKSQQDGPKSIQVCTCMCTYFSKSDRKCKCPQPPHLGTKDPTMGWWSRGAKFLNKQIFYLHVAWVVPCSEGLLCLGNTQYSLNTAM